MSLMLLDYKTGAAFAAVGDSATGAGIVTFKGADGIGLNMVGGVVSVAATSGNVLGTGVLSWAVPPTGVIQNVDVEVASTQTAPMDLVLFNDNPTATTFTDKAALAVNAADYRKVIGVIHLTDSTSLGTPTCYQALGLGLAYKLPAGTTMYGCLVTRGAPTFAAATDIGIVHVNVVQ
jgi:hypothetical protein